MDIAKVGALVFGLRMPVTRVQYVVTGCLLMALKYGVDNAIHMAVSGTPWPFLNYLSPVFSMRHAGLQDAESQAVLWMVLWALPFLWVGVSMSIRRARHAGVSELLGLLFFVPLVNFAVIALLSVLPPQPQEAEARSRQEGPRGERSMAASALVGSGMGVGVAVLMTVLSTLVYGSYGSALFLGAPWAIGFFAAWTLQREQQRGLGWSLGVSTLAVVCSGGALLLFALEGVLCLAMALPLAVLLSWMGAVVGHGVGMAAHVRPVHTSVLLVLLPLLVGAEAAVSTPPERELVTWVDIAAPPQVVWDEVVGFSELPQDDLPWYFAMGIAYPMRAELIGRGVGAVRHCIFSTGPFVEPITVWEEPRELAFDVESQPPSMHEWSPWRQVNAPHVDGYIVSHRGRFLLEPLPDGGTRLYGTTWYHLDMAPQAYWTIFSDELLHSIHRRVLHHVKRQAERR
jgi:uncharacterized membrane protein YhaH (DUF805 family)